MPKSVIDSVAPDCPRPASKYSPRHKAEAMSVRSSRDDKILFNRVPRSMETKYHVKKMGRVVIDRNHQRASQSLYKSRAVSLFVCLLVPALSPPVHATRPSPNIVLVFPRRFSSKRKTACSLFVCWNLNCMGILQTNR